MSMHITPATFYLAGRIQSLCDILKNRKILFQCKTAEEKDSLIEVFEYILPEKFYDKEHQIHMNGFKLERTEIYFSVIGHRETRYLQNFSPDHILREHDLDDLVALQKRPLLE